MSKNTIYLIATILVLIVIAAIWAPKTPLQSPTASPTNGLVNNTHAPADMEKPSSETIPAPITPTAPDAPAAAVAPISPAVPSSPAAAEPPKGKAMDADDVPTGAEVAPAPTPSTAKPAEDKGIVIPPSEGQ